MILSSVFIILAVANASEIKLNTLFRSGNPYLQINEVGQIAQPKSAVNFKKTSDGWTSDSDMLSQIKAGKSNFYLAVNKGQYGRGSLYETRDNSLVAMTNCSGDFTSSNMTGIKCSTLSLDKCTELMLNFTDLSNPAMANPVVSSAFNGAKQAVDGDFIQKFKTNLRQCSDAIMLVNNMPGNADGFRLNSTHEKILKSKLQTFSVGAADESWNQTQAGTISQAMLTVINKTEIFSKCSELLRYDQESKGRKTLLPVSALPVGKRNRRAGKSAP